MSVQEFNGRELKTAADFQQLVDDVESLMASPTDVPIESVARLHEDYEQAVKKINARLRSCDELLKRGLRNEALAQCNAEPKLLEVFLVVDFPERESWHETVKRCGLAPTELLVSIATELTDAAADEKPLADLKYQVRLHALARSPLPVRMKLMRQLSRQDENNSLWEEDLKTFEKARHNQLNGEIQIAIRDRNLNALAGLDDELRDPDWMTAPPKPLHKQVAEALAALQRQHARLELQRLEPELTAAFAAFDVPVGRKLRAAWQQWATVAALPSSDPVAEAAAPALQWLQDQDQIEREQAGYDAAVAALTKALDRGSGRLELEEKYHALAALGRGIPDDLNQRLQERLVRIDADARRGRKLKFAAATVAVLAATAIVVFAVIAVRFHTQVQAEEAYLQQLLDDQKFDEADAHFKELEGRAPKVAADTRVQSKRTALEAALEKDAGRKHELNRYVAAGRRDGVDQATLDTVLDAKDALRKAWAIARTEAEKDAIKALGMEVEIREKSLQETHNRQFQTDVAAADVELKRHEAAPADALDELDALKRKLEGILGRPHIAETLRVVRARPLLDDIKVAIRAGERMQVEARILKDIHASIGDWTKYRAALKRYVDSNEFAGTSRQREFQFVLSKDDPLWTGFQKWSDYFESNAAAFQDLIAVESVRATRLRNEGEKLLKDYPGFPFAPKVQDAIAFLGKSAVRERGSQAMEQLLALKLFKVMSAQSDDARYYFLGEQPKEDANNRVQISYFVDTEFKSTKTERVKVQKSSSYRSPQKAFEEETGKLLDQLRELKGAQWDQAFIAIMEKLYHNAEMDPILKVQLIPHVLRAAGEGSDFLPKHLERMKAEIERANLNPSVNWVLPEDKDAQEVRIHARSLLKLLARDLRDDKPLLNAADKWLQAVRSPQFDFRYEWIGWLHKADDKWTCTPRNGGSIDPQGTDVYVLIKNETGEVKLVRVGRLHPGRAAVEPGLPELVEGRPVFEKRSAAAAKSKS